jgi:uncharacterized membrane protein YhaH (DUF805 family)
LISGRSRRKEYWSFVVFCIAVNFPLAWLEQQPNLVSGIEMSGDVPLIRLLFGLYSFLPFMCVIIRRLHDTGRSGWWVLISLVPLLGWMVLLYFMLLDSDDRSNLYSPGPKHSAPSAVA